MSEKIKPTTTENEAVSQQQACYALPQDAIRHLHDEASKIENEAISLMADGFLHDAYCKLEISHALRVAANYCDGTATKLA